MYCNNLYSQSFPDLQFNHITSRDGLSSNSVACVAEDKQGFIWIGTDNGLNRYEGYRMKHYFHDDADSTSLIFNNIQSIHCDQKGRLWVVTTGGVSCFLPNKNSFVNYSAKFTAPWQLKNDGGTTVVEQKDGTIWLIGIGPVMFKVADDMTLQPVKIDIPAFTFAGIIQEGYYSILTDKKGNEWAFCANRIYQLHRQTLQPVRTFDFSSQLPKAVIRNMYEDGNGVFWVLTWGSTLWRFDPAAGTLIQDLNITMSDIKEWHYNNQRWLVAIDGTAGFYLYNNHSSAIKRITWNSNDPYTITGSSFSTLFTDSHNNLWVSTNNGVNYVETSKRVFDIFPVTDPGAQNYERETTTILYSYFEDDNEAWMTKRYESTLVFDDSMHLKKFYKGLYPLNAKWPSWHLSPYYFFKDRNDLFITTDSGIIVYNMPHGTTTFYAPGNMGRMEELRTILPLDSNRILIRSVSNGLYIFNTVTKKFTRHLTYNDTASGYLAPRLNYALKTSAGEIFLAGDAGRSLTKYVATREYVEPVQPNNEKSYHLLSTRLFGMEEDNLGKIWIASSNGMFVYNPATNNIEQHYTENGRMGSLFRVCIDNYHNIWTNGSSGIWCYAVAKNKWINFNSQDGLPGSDFEGIMARKKNGDIAVGLEGALAFFHPAKLYTVSSQPPAVITEAAIDEKTVVFPLAKDQSKNLSLSPGQHSFSVDFTILSYYHAAAMQYYYKLEPLMNDFRNNNNGHINFNGLNPGHYVLHVKGEDKAGNVYAKEDTLNIDIEPWWYQSWWFRIPAVIGLAALIIFLVRRRITTIRNESSLKQRIVETEMQALRAQMDPHFIFNSLSSIENFIMQNEKRMASDYLNKFARLIRMILDSSRDELVTVTKDMEALQLYIDLEQISFNNKFTYNTIIDPVLLHEDYRVPSLLIQPYVENAIVHGLSHSREKDLILTVSAQLENDYIKYSIEDNGIGREQALQYKLRNKPNHKSVGLKITEERINIFNRQTNGTGAVVFTDLYDAANKPCGTRVDITIKAT